MQVAKVLTIGNDGVVVDAPARALGVVTVPEYAPIYVVVRVPTVNSGTLTFESSDDNGTSWQPCLGAINLTNAEPTMTAGVTGTTTGNFRLIFGPYLLGTKFRIRSSVGQTATVNIRFMASL